MFKKGDRLVKDINVINHWRKSLHIYIVDYHRKRVVSTKCGHKFLGGGWIKVGVSDET